MLPLCPLVFAVSKPTLWSEKTICQTARKGRRRPGVYRRDGPVKAKPAAERAEEKENEELRRTVE